jgi:hypothetical protein
MVKGLRPLLNAQELDPNKALTVLMVLLPFAELPGVLSSIKCFSTGKTTLVRSSRFKINR